MSILPASVNQTLQTATSRICSDTAFAWEILGRSAQHGYILTNYPNTFILSRCRDPRAHPIQRRLPQIVSTQLNDLDPRYDRMVDPAADSADADENRFLKSTIPLDAADR